MDIQLSVPELGKIIHKDLKASSILKYIEYMANLTVTLGANGYDTALNEMDAVFEFEADVVNKCEFILL